MFFSCLVDFFRLDYEIAGDNFALRICSSVEKHPSNSRYHAYMENRLAYANLENFSERLENVGREVCRNSRRNNVINGIA